MRKRPYTKTAAQVAKADQQYAAVCDTVDRLVERARIVYNDTTMDDWCEISVEQLIPELMHLTKGDAEDVLNWAFAVAGEAIRRLAQQ